MGAALLIPGLVFFGALVLISFEQTLNITSRSQTEAQSSFWKALLGALTGKTYIAAITKLARSAVSRWALAQLAPVGRWFLALNAVLVAHNKSLGVFEETVADAFDRLGRVVVPRAASRAVAPTKAQAKAAAKAAKAAGQTATHATTAVAHLGADVRPRIKATEHAIDVTLPGEIGRIRTRTKEIGKEIEHPNHGLLSRWAKWLWAAALGGIFVRALTKRFPWLFCRKVNTIGKRLCGLDDSVLQGLLDATLLIAGTVSLVEFVRDMQAVEDVAVGALREFIRDAP